ncbi:ArsR/SmtB family transcription factor [Streptomyces sp. LE64]|uniref:ArsR/SmtB family transcription factor n=1 Tax=unclassified Streptomyces TaxID=2593676 RepID=UPI00331E66C8
MDLEQRLTALERRLTALEGADPPSTSTPPAPPTPPGDPARAEPRADLWALDGFREQLADAGPEAADGGVLFTGTVALPTGARYEWQYGELTERLVEADWSPRAEVFAALGHPVRLRLLREVLSGSSTAAELSELEGLGTTGQIYHHLRQLAGAGWLHTTGRGRYEVPATRVVPLLVAVTLAGSP